MSPAAIRERGRTASSGPLRPSRCSLGARTLAVRPCLAAAVLAASLVSSRGEAAPKHPICADLGPSLGVGVSHFSAAGDWAERAAMEDGVVWRFLYWYLVPTDDPLDAQA